MDKSNKVKQYGIIYKITNLINGKIYVGRTTQDIQVRFKQHCCDRLRVLPKAIKKHGKENFKIEQICKVCNEKDNRIKRTSVYKGVSLDIKSGNFMAKFYKDGKMLLNKMFKEEGNIDEN